MQEKAFKVKFPDHKKHFLYRIADFLFNNTFNQRMRRGMLHNVGGVWYERIYPKNNPSGNLNEKNFTTLFQGPVVVEKKVIAVLGFPYNGTLLGEQLVCQDTSQQKMSLSRPFNFYLKTNLQPR